MIDLVLASASPRRQDLLIGIGVDFEVSVADLDEPAIAAGLEAVEAVITLAEAKATAVRAGMAHDKQVLGADTMVIGPDGIVGKPQSPGHTAQLLRSYRDASIDVVTGVVLVAADSTKRGHVLTRVHFGPIADPAIDAYVLSGAGDDKAGALELQGAAHPFIDRVEGCWTNVIGLPLCLVSELLADGRVVSCGSEGCMPFSGTGSRLV